VTKLIFYACQQASISLRDLGVYVWGDRSLSQQVIKDKKQTQMYSALGENKPQLILLNIE
jgi:hypothetical protein